MGLQPAETGNAAPGAHAPGGVAREGGEWGRRWGQGGARQASRRPVRPPSRLSCQDLRASLREGSKGCRLLSLTDVELTA